MPYGASRASKGPAGVVGEPRPVLSDIHMAAAGGPGFSLEETVGPGPIKYQAICQGKPVFPDDEVQDTKQNCMAAVFQ